MPRLEDVEPALILPGEGEVITERDERSIRIKGAHHLVDVTETRYGPGEAGPDLHVHREHADAFFVLEGELEFRLGDHGRRVVRGEPGTLVLVPAGVVHSFRNASGAAARFLNIHAPSKRFADSLRIRRDRQPYDPAEYDSFDAPADGGRDVSDALARGPGEGDAVAIGGSSAVFKVETGDGDGTFSLTESTLESGFPGPVPHVHERLLDSFYVLEGTLTVRLGDATAEAPAGSFAFIPPGNVHTFSNPTAEPVRVLNLMAPAGFEQYLKEMARSLPPTGGLPDPAVMAEIASRHDFRPASDA
jgi:mannose-6-phosphate isomerase-like protein (cupin superfamily)